MTRRRLTPKQRTLLSELDELSDTLGFDYRSALDLDGSDRTTWLEVVKHKMITEFVISRYTIVDDMLSSIIGAYFFGQKRSETALWRTKRFKLFNQYIMDNLYPLQKLALIRELYNIPREINSRIQNLNDLRNALSHSLFPQNRLNVPTWRKMD